MPFLDKEGLKYLLENLTIVGGGGSGSGSDGTSNYFKFDINDTGSLLLYYEGDEQPNFEIVDSGHLYYYLDATKTQFVDLGKVVGDGDINANPSCFLNFERKIQQNGDSGYKFTFGSFDEFDSSLYNISFSFYDCGNGKQIYQTSSKDTVNTAGSNINYLITSQISHTDLCDSPYYTGKGVVCAASSVPQAVSSNSVLKAICFISEDTLETSQLRKATNRKLDYAYTCFSLHPDMISSGSFIQKTLGTTNTLVLKLDIFDYQYAKKCMQTASSFYIPNLQSLVSHLSIPISGLTASDKSLPMVFQLSDALGSDSTNLYIAPHSTMNRKLYDFTQYYVEFDVYGFVANIPYPGQAIAVPITEITTGESSELYKGWIMGPMSV